MSLSNQKSGGLSAPSRHAMSVFPGKFREVVKIPETADIAIRFESCNMKLRTTGDKGELVKQWDTQMALPVVPLGTDVGIFCIRLNKEQVLQILEALSGI